MAKVSKKAIEKKVNAICSKALAGKPVPIMETVSIYNVGMKSAAAGDSDEVIAAKVSAYVDKVTVAI